jgi:hypothetical protein
MHADATFMSDEDYEAAQARLAKRKAIMQPRKPIHPTKFGVFVAGLWIGAAITGLVAYVIHVSGPLSGIAVILGTALIIGVIGVNMGRNE